MKLFARSFFLSALSVLVPSAAFAHSLLVDPAPVTNDDGAKTGPCGCEFGGTPACPNNYPVTEVVAGQTYTVKWKETINHAGDFRIAFSSNSVQTVTGADLDANVLDTVADNNTTAGAELTTTVTIPNTPCASCTLQLRQFMDGAAQPYYYSCASIKVIDPNAGSSSSSSGTGTGSGGGSGQGGSDMGEGGSTGPGMAPPPTPIETGNLCSFGAPTRGSAGLFALAALGIAAGLRRRRD